MKKLFVIVCVCLMAGNYQARGENSTDAIPFLNAPFALNIRYTPIQFADNNLTASQQAAAFIQHTRQAAPEGYVKALQEFRRNMNLNDWLYFKLIQQLSAKLGSQDPGKTALYTWYFLAASGYDSRLVVSDHSIRVFVQTPDSIYDEDFFTLDGASFARLPIYPEHLRGDEQWVMCTYDIPGSEQLFSLTDQRFPRYTPARTVQRRVWFEYQNRTYYYTFQSDPDYLDLYKDHPNAGLGPIFTAPLSPMAYNSLLPQLRKDLTAFTQYKGIEFLMTFTRTAFPYESDKDKGIERYLTPEQTLFASTSDCEDRAALFYYLVKEIYNLPMVVVLYPTHISVAVNFNKTYGKPILFDGRTYSICEPTNTDNSLKIGEFLEHLENSSYDIVLHYTPASN